MSKMFGLSRKRLCVLIVIFIVVTVLIWLFLYSPRPPESEHEPSIELFGMAEPLTRRYVDEGINITRSFETLRSLGVSRLREWTWMTRFLINQTTLNQAFKETLDLVISEMRESNITIMGMSQDFPNWMTGIDGDRQAVPYRNTMTGSDYMRFLDAYKESWETLARTFPNITMWERE